MRSQFQTGSTTNTFFYVFMGIAAIVMGIANDRFSLPILIFFIVFFVGTTTAFAIAAKKTKRYTLYGRLQMVAFAILNCFISISFDSAQAFIYAMCFSTILGFVFIDVKVSKFQFIQSCIIVVIAAAFISYYTGSKQTMLAYGFGTIVLLVMNWVVVSMVIHIRFQYRKNSEQERSLDDMLKVVEAKCDEARNATKIKSRFLAHMSHEIRTPINAVIGMNEMILRESKDEEILKYASETKTAADSLLGIINDILDITRIEAGKLTPIYVEYNPAKLINDIYNLIRFKAESKNLDFIVIIDENIPKRLKGDDIRLKQIVLNLLSNAVKYTHEGSVTLEIRYLGEGILSFSVKDTGIGIKEENIEKLFEAFARMDENINRNIEGTGLGLNITSSLLKMFGSRLEVASKYGTGSYFAFDIFQEIIDPTPIGKIDLNNTEFDYKAYKEDFTAPNALVLVVDDNAMNRKVFKNLLKKTQVQIEEAPGGVECVEMIKQKRYDIIFMDHMMPVMDGIQALGHVRNDEDSLCKDVPVIALTANAVVGAKELYFNAGFDNFLSKPVDPKKLEKMLLNALNPTLVASYEPETDNSAVAEENVELPIINGIDWRYARLNFDNDNSLLDTIKMFRKSIAKDVEEIDGYFSTIDTEKSINSYRIKVHGMKSTAALIGIVRLAGMAMELEEAAREKNAEVIRLLHPIFIKIWKDYYNELAVLFSEEKALKNAVEFHDEILGIFENIRNAAKMMDVDVLDEMSKNLDEYSFEGEYSEKIDQVKKSIFNFEVEKLRECYYN
ncbi:MAG: response regulator [Oscillospiraceae bacterium]|nr:response regulator [Oscillospiraceae bacterium]